MNRRYMYLALGLVILVNVVVLLGVARNRSGVPDATLVLSERELPLSWDFRDKENTGVSLQLNTNTDTDEQLWFDESKLVELGFDTRQFTNKEAGRGRRVLPKKAYVVLEYDGGAWQRYRQRQLEEIEELPRKVAQGKLEAEIAENQKQEKLFQLTVASHLFSVDVGLDPKALRKRYADRSHYIIVPAQVRMNIEWSPKTSGNQDMRRVFGRVQQILVDQLHVPQTLHRGLQILQGNTRIQSGYTYYDPKAPARARYEAQVAFGQRLEPWVMGIKVFNAEEAGAATSHGL